MANPTSTDKVNPSAHGWGAAALTTLLAIACVGMAYTVYKNTYHHPNDVLQPVAKTAEH
jgi:hypothetical protein